MRSRANYSLTALLMQFYEKTFFCSSGKGQKFSNVLREKSLKSPGNLISNQISN